MAILFFIIYFQYLIALQKPRMVSVSRSSRLIPTFVKNRFYNVFQKLKFSSRIKARMEIMPQAYKQYVEDRISIRNAEPG